MKKQKKCKHKVLNRGYMEWNLWADKKVSRVGAKQKQCPKCKLWLFKEEY